MNLAIAVPDAVFAILAIAMRGIHRATVVLPRPGVLAGLAQLSYICPGLFREVWKMVVNSLL